jgi:hypothetical protein
MSTRISKLLTAAQLPPMDAYLDYLSMRYAIRLRFLPDDHILADKPAYIRGKPKLNFPSKHRLDNLIAHLAEGNLEDLYCHTTASIPRVASPHPDKLTNPTGIHERWIQSLSDFTILLYTDGSKLEDGRTGSRWGTYCVGNGVAREIWAGHCHLGTRAEVFDAELHAAQEALTTLQHLDTPRRHRVSMHPQSVSARYAPRKRVTNPLLANRSRYRRCTLWRRMEDSRRMDPRTRRHRGQ